MTKKIKLLTLSCVLVFCVTGAVIISTLDFEEKMTGEETVLVDEESSDIVYLAWNYGDDQMEFTCEEGVWSYVPDSVMPVNNELLNDIAWKLSNIVSNKKVEEPQSLGVYGLGDPRYDIVIKTEDEEYELSIGDETFSDGEVYVSNGDGYVYLTDVSIIDDIAYNLMELVQEEDIPDMTAVGEICIENDDTVDMIYTEEGGLCYSDAYTYYLKDGDSWLNLDNDAAGYTFTSLTELVWEGCVDYNAGEEERSDYGLDKPDAAVSVTYENDDAVEEVFEYELGTNGEKFYARLKDSDMIYSIDQTVYDAAVNASYDELRPDELILLDMGTVESIDIHIDNEEYNVTVEKDGEDEFKYKLDGKDIEFADVIDKLFEMTSAGDGDEAPEGEAPADEGSVMELSILFNRSTEEYEKVEIVFYRYDGKWCISSLNDNEKAYTIREDVVELKEMINSIMLDAAAE